MEGSTLLESLDSLWFFTNVISSKPQPTDHFTGNEEPEKPLSPVVQIIHQNDPPPEGELLLLTPKCHKCGEFPVEVEAEGVKPTSMEEEVGFLTPPSRKEERKKRKKKSKRKILGELDLGGYNCGFFGVLTDEGIGKQGMFIRNQEYYYHRQVMKMPPLDDGMAMKQHLKSWAYAVACTVR
ncbi:hypothetical protein Tsubulata_019231 [Turnera subulata]|uniref:Uncharacterized protein n=1 Tax=Turnera subulata TaxID=218843 RepID=A0A9Q0F3Y7_9ROSI|nr:hypothetical protein Tsubulata_019231 [Turnera subulata]